MISAEFKSYLEEIIKKELKSNSLGILGSKRKFSILPVRRDNNLFFTLMASLIIQDSKLQELEKLIETSIKKNLSTYKNKYGRNTYNFWTTSPNNQWPGSIFKHRIKHFWIPDDLDCTALSYKFHADSEFLEMRSHIQQFTNSALQCEKQNEHTYYSTWFGKKIKPEFDLCVTCNYLIVLEQKGISPNSLEKGLFSRIKNIVENIEEQNFTRLSPNYQEKVIIYWHLARLLKAYPSEFKKHKNVFIQKLKSNLVNNIDNIKGLWITFSLKELEVIPSKDFLESDLKYFIDNSIYFKAPMLYSWKYLPRKWSESKMFNVQFYSQAFNSALVLYYESIYQ